MNPEMSVGGQEASGGPLLRGQTSGALLPSAVTCSLCYLELSLGLFCKMGIEKPVSSLLPPPLTSLPGWATMSLLAESTGPGASRGLRRPPASLVKMLSLYQKTAILRA